MPDEDSGGSRLKTFFTTLPGVLTGVAALLTAIAALAGVFLTGEDDVGVGDPAAGTTSAQDPRPQAEFLSPQDGPVDRFTRVSFRYTHVDPDADLWLIEGSGPYYPHPSCAEEGERPTVQRLPGEPNGEWSGTIEIGGEGTAPGDRFQLLVLLTHEQETELLREQIRGWCSPQAVWRGISDLPKGSKVLDKVEVVRS